jgi:hypothetical protein
VPLPAALAHLDAGPLLEAVPPHAGLVRLDTVSVPLPAARVRLDAGPRLEAVPQPAARALLGI